MTDLPLRVERAGDLAHEVSQMPAVAVERKRRGARTLATARGTSVVRQLMRIEAEDGGTA